eukprot:scaffold82276_cov67-Cyclotella_meneghiniana.AAC.2
MATNDKYDRQLRLWGPAGQKSLSSTLVVLIGSSACGTESLKNLVLPGVGAFLILDDVLYGGDDDSSVAVDEIIMYDAGRDNDNGQDNENNKAGSSCCFRFDKSADTANFFAGSSSSDDASTKAALACRLLCELNPDVSGFHRTVPSLERVEYASLLKELLSRPLDKNASSSSSSSSFVPLNILVITADQPSAVFLPVSKACHSLNLPFINVRSYGLLGYVRIQTPWPYHVVRDAKKTNKPLDLRVADGAPFDELKRVYDSIDALDTISDSKVHGHVPYIIVLMQALQKWRDAHDDESPKTYDEKEEFRRLIRSMARDYDNELNFQEAYDHAHLAWVECKLSDDSSLLLEKCNEEVLYGMAIDADMDITSSGNEDAGRQNTRNNGTVLQFQLMACALRRFLNESNNVPPLEGTIPDMACDTKTFVALQEAYRTKAESDREKLTRHIVNLLEECKTKSNGCKVLATMPAEEDIITFCKNSRDIHVLETRPLFMEYRAQDPASPIVASLQATVFDASSTNNSALPNFETLQADSREDLMCSTMDPYDTDPMQTPLLWFIALRACDAFFDRHGHYPGKHDQNLALEADTNEIFKLMGEVVGHMGLTDCDFIKDSLLNDEKGKDVAREVVRYDEAEIHTIAAVMGGVASQEAVKLITGQYIPVNDTYVYNGIASTAGVHRF